MNELTTVSLGTITHPGGKLFISDPCYVIRDEGFKLREGDLGRIYTAVEALAGAWDISVEMSDEGAWGTRVATLRAQHRERYSDGVTVDALDVSLCVDAGLMSIGSIDDAESRDMNYDGLLDVLFDKNGRDVRDGVIFENIAVSSTGFGDGSYPGFVNITEDGAIVGIEVVFIDEDEDDEDKASDY